MPYSGFAALCFAELVPVNGRIKSAMTGRAAVMLASRQYPQGGEDNKTKQPLTVIADLIRNPAGRQGDAGKQDNTDHTGPSCWL